MIIRAKRYKDFDFIHNVIGFPFLSLRQSCEINTWKIVLNQENLLRKKKFFLIFLKKKRKNEVILIYEIGKGQGPTL